MSVVNNSTAIIINDKDKDDKDETSTQPSIPAASPWGNFTAVKRPLSSDSDDDDDDNGKDVQEQVNEFLSEVADESREQEIKRIEKAFKLNPLDILGLPTNSTVTQVKKKFRELSLLTHPDKVKQEWRERAQNAFTKLSDAQIVLLDDEKRSSLVSHIVAARRKVIDEKRKVERHTRKQLIRDKKATISLLNEPYPSYETQEGFENLVANELREVLLEQEMRKRVFMTMADKEEKRQLEENKKLEKEQESKEDMEENWEKSRDKRISSWRKFQGKGKMKFGSRKKMKIN